jgi:hypothetical protein
MQMVEYKKWAQLIKLNESGEGPNAIPSFSGIRKVKDIL